VNPTQPPLPGPPSTRGPSTQEIPAVPPTASSGPATAQFPSAAAAVAAQPQPTGPVDYVPGPPPVAEQPAPVPAVPTGSTAADHDFLPGLEDEPRHRDPHARRRMVSGLLAVGSLALLELGLLVHEAGVRLWSSVPLWSAFASLAGVLGLAVLGRPGALGGRVRTVAAAGLGGLAVFWLLVVVRSADTDRGFLLTAALGCLGGAVWLSRSGDAGRQRA
jgi:hypothetical protein